MEEQQESRKDRLIKASKKEDDYGKIVLGIRMPDGTKELIINDNVENKIKYIKDKYDENLKMIGAPVRIEEWLFVRK